MNPDRRLELGRGEGTVVAVPGVALLVMASEAPESLLDVVRAGAQSPSPGRGLARRLAALLTNEQGALVPSFGMVADVEEGLLVFLYGTVVAITGPEGDERLSGSDATTWVDRVLGPESETVLIAPEVGAVSTSTSFELTAGIVPAGWMRIAPGRPSLAFDTAGPAPVESPDRSEAETTTEGPDAGDTPPAPARPASGPVLDPSPPVPAANPLPAEESSPPPAGTASSDPQTEPLRAMPPVTPPPLPPPGGSAARPGDADDGDVIAEDGRDDQPVPDGPVPDGPVTDPAPDGPAPDGPAPDGPVTDPVFESISLAPDRASLRAPLPAEGPGEQDDDAEPVPERKMVQGIRCSRQHFNSPDSAYCSSCGISMVHQTHNLVRGERPPLGFLVFDDGSTFTLDDRYVLGREPETDPLVQSREARPIPLDDPQMSVSRVHAEIQLVGWDVQLVDRGSTNGTHILNQRGDGWDPVPPQQPLTVAPGSRIAVGQRTFVYETPQRG